MPINDDVYIGCRTFDLDREYDPFINCTFPLVIYKPPKFLESLPWSMNVLYRKLSCLGVGIPNTVTSESVRWDVGNSYLFYRCRGWTKTSESLKRINDITEEVCRKDKESDEGDNINLVPIKYGLSRYLDFSRIELANFAWDYYKTEKKNSNESVVRYDRN